MRKKIKQFFLIIFLSLFLLGFSIAQTNNPNWIFYCDFENPSNIWDDYDGNPDYDIRRILSPGPDGRSGNHVFRISVPEGERGVYDLTKILPDSYDELYARWYIKYESGFNFNAPNHGGGLHAGDRSLLGRSDFRPSGTNWFSAWVDYRNTYPHTPFLYTYYPGMYQDCSDPNGACWGDSYPCVYDYPDSGRYCTKNNHLPDKPLISLQEDRWYCIEMMVDAGSPSPDGTNADGKMELWVDGQSIGFWDDIWFRTTSNLKINILWLSLFHHDGTHSTAGILYDEVVVSTERIGLIETVPPARPTNVEILPVD